MRLFEPIQLKQVQFRNRLGVSPMCQYSAVDGFANDWHLVHLGARAAGGAGLVMMEATAVTPEGRISPGDLGLWDDAHITPLKRITAFIKSQGAVPGLQIAHAGRKASCAVPWEGGHALDEASGGWRPIFAPSAIPFDANSPVPTAMDAAQIAMLATAFADSAKRALAAGFEVLEIHAAHGYLLHSFLSPLSNQRTDAYGGSFENRTRLLKEVIAAVQAVWPAELPLFVRISATDWVEGGWDLEQSIQLCAELKTMGVDCIDVSSGGLVPDAVIPVTPGYQVSFAEAIKQQAEISTATVGFITDAQQAEAILEKNQADFVFLGRAWLSDPHWGLHAAQQLGVDAPWPNQYLRAKPRLEPVRK